VSATTTLGERRSIPGRLIGAAALSVLTYFAARAVLEMDTLATRWRVTAAIVPVPVFAWVLYEILRSSRQLDEMQRRMHLEALAFAYPLLLTLLMLLGLLELAIPLDPDNWSYRHVWQMQGIIYLLGLILAYRRYGVDRP
jgi:hypothetical protein